MLAKWANLFLLNRKQHLSGPEVVSLHESAIDMLETLKTILPERTGSRMPGSAESIGWNIWKAHSLLHLAMDRMNHGYSETVSAQGAECAHKVTRVISFTIICSIYYHFQGILICFV